MASETFKKRQKEAARREKKHQKAARRMERKSEKARTDNKIEEDNPNPMESALQQGPTIL